MPQKFVYKNFCIHSMIAPAKIIKNAYFQYYKSATLQAHNPSFILMPMHISVCCITPTSFPQHQLQLFYNHTILRSAQAVTNSARSNQHNFSDGYKGGILYSRRWRHEITKTQTLLVHNNNEFD